MFSRLVLHPLVKDSYVSRYNHNLRILNDADYSLSETCLLQIPSQQFLKLGSHHTSFNHNIYILKRSQIQNKHITLFR